MQCLSVLVFGLGLDPDSVACVSRVRGHVYQGRKRRQHHIQADWWPHSGHLSMPTCACRLQIVIVMKRACCIFNLDSITDLKLFCRAIACQKLLLPIQRYQSPVGGPAVKSTTGPRRGAKRIGKVQFDYSILLEVLLYSYRSTSSCSVAIEVERSV